MGEARVLVVAGTNGIGKAITEAAERLDARVAVDGRSVGLDVRDAAAVKERVGSAAQRLGGLDHVVSTAAVLRIGDVATSPQSDLAEGTDVNVTGTLNLAHATHRHLRESRASLTLFASRSFTRGRPQYVAYSASKAAVVNIAQGLADECSADGIRVNSVSPERTDTPMRQRAFPDESRAGLLSPVDVAEATPGLILSDLTGQVFESSATICR